MDTALEKEVFLDLISDDGDYSITPNKEREEELIRDAIGKRDLESDNLGESKLTNVSMTNLNHTMNYGLSCTSIAMPFMMLLFLTIAIAG